MLEIKNLQAAADGHEILKGIQLKVAKGEVHAVMGPNGSGKSTLSKIIAGHPDYQVTGGTVTFKGEDLTSLDPSDRALKGIFMGFQYPVEVPGINNAEFLRAAYNAKQKQMGKPELDAVEFEPVLAEKMNKLQMDVKYKERGLNDSFSGGEKKRNEILQMGVLEPELAILDETDSGLDIDALKIVAQGINAFRNKDNAVLLITHYQRLLDYVKPDYVHVLSDGKIVKSGDKSLAMELEEKGYDWLEKEPPTAVEST